MNEEFAGVSTRVIKPVLANLVTRGVDVEAVLARVELEPHQLTDPDGRLPHGTVIELWRLAAEVTGDSCFGLHVAESLELSMLGVQGDVFLASSTLARGLERATRYHRLTHDVSELALEMGTVSSTIRHTLPGGRVLPRHPAEFIIALLMFGMREATGEDWAPLEVRFAHDEPSERVEHRRVFGLSPRFGAGENALVIPAERLSMPCRGADSKLCGILDRHAESLLSELPRVSSFTDRVRALMMAELKGGDPSAVRLAEKLSMSVRTLGRRLEAEETSHRELLDSLREELGKRYLGDETLGIGEIAFLLGFSEASAFHRAFKRWTGVTPSEHRAQLPNRQR